MTIDSDRDDLRAAIAVAKSDVGDVRDLWKVLRVAEQYLNTNENWARRLHPLSAELRRMVSGEFDGPTHRIEQISNAAHNLCAAADAFVREHQWPECAICGDYMNPVEPGHLTGDCKKESGPRP